MANNHNKISGFKHDKLGNDPASLKRSLANRLHEGAPATGEGS
jgi:hypothetical protein